MSNKKRREIVSSSGLGPGSDSGSESGSESGSGSESESDSGSDSGSDFDLQLNLRVPLAPLTSKKGIRFDELLEYVDLDGGYLLRNRIGSDSGSLRYVESVRVFYDLIRKEFDPSSTALMEMETDMIQCIFMIDGCDEPQIHSIHGLNERDGPKLYSKLQRLFGDSLEQ